MKIFVAIIAILIVVSADYEDEDEEEDYDEDEYVPITEDYDTVMKRPKKEIHWTGNVKELIDTAQLEPGIILNISRNIFGNMNINCNGTMGMPNATFLPSPTAECDLTLMEDLRAAVLNPQTFNYEKFLKDFWSSIAGVRLLKEIQKRGVSEAVVKAAMKEIWFNTTSYRDTAFNRLFLATNSLGSGEYKDYNSWYTFDVGKQNISDCIITIRGKELPIVVSGFWMNPASVLSTFIYPNHPFVDLTLYTLCVWTKNPANHHLQQCLVVVPGTEKRFQILTAIYADSHNVTFLAKVIPYYHDCLQDGSC